MEITIVTERYPPEVVGGGEVSAKMLAISLAKVSTNTVNVITQYKSHPKVSTEINGRLIINRIIPPGKQSMPQSIRRNELFFFNSTKKLISFIKRSDIIHALNMRSIVGSVIAGKLKGIPVVATINDHWATCYFSSHYRNEEVCEICSKPGLSECYEESYDIQPPLAKINYIRWSMKTRRYFLKRCDGFIGLSNRVLEILEANGINRNKPSMVIPPLINASKYEYNKPPNEKKVLYIGRIDFGKGALAAIKAIAEVEDAELIMVGTGYDLNKCKQLTKKLNIANRVKFVDKLPHQQVQSTIRECDVVLAPFNRVEPFGRVLLEANACGRGIITSKTGGGGLDFIKNGENGFLIDPNNIKELAKVIEAVVTDNKLAIKLGVQGRKMVEHQMDYRKMTKKVIGFYNKILQRQ